MAGTGSLSPHVPALDSFYPTAPPAEAACAVGSVRGLSDIVPCEPNCYPVLKVCNIAWDLTQDDLIRFLLPVRLPTQSTLPLVHILMNRETGKTLPEAFVEFGSASDVTVALSMRNKKVLKGRIVTLMPSSQEELMRAIFPSFRGIFHGVDAIPEASPSQSYFGGGFHDRLLASSEEETFFATQLGALGIDINDNAQLGRAKQQRDCTFLKRDEINHLLAVCRNFKLFFSRKCAQRPFENVVTILLKFPWHQKHLVAVLQRDHIFEMCKLCVEALHGHLMRSYYHIEEGLMERLLKAVIMVPLFTEKQKLLLLNVAKRPCPPGFACLLNICEATPSTTAHGSPHTEMSLQYCGNGSDTSSVVPSPPVSLGMPQSTSAEPASRRRSSQDPWSMAQMNLSLLPQLFGAHRAQMPLALAQSAQPTPLNTGDYASSPSSDVEQQHRVQELEEQLMTAQWRVQELQTILQGSNDQAGIQQQQQQLGQELQVPQDVSQAKEQQQQTH
ncbi:hypothetical protein RI367_008357 [Sorochytrium milnesiophthora]